MWGMVKISRISLSEEQIKKLFVHRKDVFSVQHKSGAYFPIKRPLTLYDIKRHLRGDVTIGVYCLDTDNTVKWACIDLDGADIRRLGLVAEAIYSLFSDFGRMLEFSGFKGFHVWVFFKSPVNAVFAQKLVKSRLNRLNILKYEVFPKQTELNENRKFGNLVKLPLAVHKISGKRSKIIRLGGLK